MLASERRTAGAVLITVLAPVTPLAGMAFFPSLLLTIVFRIWGGNALRVLKT
jgi:hypothetical protein